MGEGLYPQLVQAACLLATDPFPRVARLGKAALLMAEVELTHALPPSSSPHRHSVGERPGGHSFHVI